MIKNIQKLIKRKTAYRIVSGMIIFSMIFCDFPLSLANTVLGEYVYEGREVYAEEENLGESAEGIDGVEQESAEASASEIEESGGKVTDEAANTTEVLSEELPSEELPKDTTEEIADGNSTQESVDTSEEKTAEETESGTEETIVPVDTSEEVDEDIVSESVDTYVLFTTGSTEDDPNFIHNENNEITIKNSEFVAYSQACQNYPRYHQNDKITLTSVDDQTNISGTGFAGLGSEEYPFAGSLSMASNTDITLNLDAPLFNYVYDTVTIVNNGSPLRIARFYYRGAGASESTPLLANCIVAAGSEDTRNTAVWQIDVRKPTDQPGNYLKGFGGLIGNLGNSASLTIHVTMNCDGDDININSIAMTGDSDTGLLCGVMEENSSLTASFESDRGIGDISAKNGNVGGLVGTMKSGSRLTYSSGQVQNSGALITAKDGYAGGIVGYNQGGTIIFGDNVDPYAISQNIQGTLGVGSVYGYYQPVDNMEFDVKKYAINDGCKLSSGIASEEEIRGYVGGLFGVLETIGNFTVNGAAEDGSLSSVSSVFASGAVEGYGGIIGRYRTNRLTNTLTIKNISVACKRDGSTLFYGGGIGIISDLEVSENETTTNYPGYVKFDNFAVNKAQNASVRYRTFGGLVARADNSFVEGNNVTIATNGNYRGGAAVGSLENGVLKLSGKFDISGTVTEKSDLDIYKEGKIVGYRDNGLIYADGWTYTGNASEVDNVGSWGDIIVMDGSIIVKSDVLTEDTDHTVTIAAAPPKITKPTEYAVTSIVYSIDSTKNPILKNNEGALADGSTARNLSFSGTINLSGTGLRGITRDNAPEDSIVSMEGNKVSFIGEVTGENNATIILDFENVGGKPVYRHRYNGLFGLAKNVTVSNLSFGNDTNKGKMNLTAKEKLFVGSLAGETDGTLTAKNIIVNTAITAEGGSEIYVGGLLGWVTNNESQVNVSDSTFNCIIVDNNTHNNNNTKQSCFGGVIGRIDHEINDTSSWSFSNCNITGSIESTVEQGQNRVGGLIAVIDDNKAETQRSLSLSGITVNGLSITGQASTTMGGLLGYSWLGVNTTFTNVNIKGEVTNPNVQDFAGLVYQGSGYWVVEQNNGLTINSFTASAAKAKSFGVLLNSGRNDGNSAIYLEIKEKGYHIKNASLDEVNQECVFDEICVYTATNGDLLSNGQGVISINVGGTNGGLTMDGTSASNTYKAQTSRGNKSNLNTRYYYNLDVIRNKSDKNDPEKLLIWALNTYAHKNIKRYFEMPEGFSAETIPNATYNMQGYSWYPVDVTNTVTVNGTFIFYNYELEASEKKKTGENVNVYTSLGEKNGYTQHHLMQNGLFRDVIGTVNVGNVTFSGSIGTDYYGSGALVWGTVKGSSASSTAAVKMADGGSISLDGIYVHDLEFDGKAYYPLLINKVTSYSSVALDSVSNTDAYSSSTKIKKEGIYPKAATSLIGSVGADNNTNINLGFSKIKLDGRTTLNAEKYELDDVYKTKCSLFTHATLLECYRYASGSSGVYNYTYEEDWGGDADNPNRNVTYGSEISDNVTRNQYFGQEFWYNGESHVNGKYTIYKKGIGQNTAEGEAPYSYSGFLPYVYTVDSVKENTTLNNVKAHQLSVNHASVGLSGCGTYNDPYQIPTATELQNIAILLSGTSETGFKINLPTLSENESSLSTKRWDTNGDLEYKYDGTNYVATKDDGKQISYSPTMVREYVAGAYFQITADLELTKEYCGLGSSTENEEAVFRGVIIGENHTITLKGSNPLIVSSYGSVVKDLVVKVGEVVSIKKKDNTPLTFAYNSGETAYGTVIGKVLGGDNIIDNVSVLFDDDKYIEVLGNYCQSVPIGGYVGVAQKGTLIFRNMDRSKKVDIQGIPSGKVQNGDDNTLVNTDNLKWLYVNPIIGRVLNAAVFTESDEYRPFEDGTRATYDESGNKIFVDKEGKVVSSASEATSGVTMRNGTKDYSIPDIDKEGGSFSLTDIRFTYDDKNPTDSTNKDNWKRYTNFTLDFPNAQSLFLMSEITQTGLSGSTFGYRDQKIYNANTNKPAGGYYESDKWGVASYQGYRSVHNAEYSHVGEGSIGDEPTSGDIYNDYRLTRSDGFWETRDSSSKKRAFCVPYIIRKYTPEFSEYIDNEGNECEYGGYVAFVMTHQYNYLNINFTGKGTYYMPDGFRGIGMLGHKGVFVGDKFAEEYRDMIPHVFGINGNGIKVSLNMNLHTYFNIAGKDDASLVTDQPYMGYGFFDSIIQNKPEADKKINLDDSAYQVTNFTITGLVNYDVRDSSNGQLYAYTDNMNEKKFFCVGGLAGSTPGTSEVYQNNFVNVTPSNLSVSGVRYTGGLIGYNASKNDAQSKTTIKDISPQKLSVKSAIYGGGLIGCSRYMALDISNVHIAEPDIVCTLDFSKGKYDTNAIGGIVGYVYTDKNTGQVFLHNITIGMQNPGNNYTSYIGYADNYPTDTDYPTDKTYETIRVGGLIGHINVNDNPVIDYTTKIESCMIYNVDIFGHWVGGVIGVADGGNASVGVFNVVVKSTPAKSKTISGRRRTYNNFGAGGIGGDITGIKKLVVDNCLIEGYIISSQCRASGIAGYVGCPLTTNNISIKDVTFISDNDTGGLVGTLNNVWNGYNICTDNIRFQTYSSNTEYSTGTDTDKLRHGHIIGNSQEEVIKLVGLSRLNMSSSADCGSERMVGNKKATEDNPYGTGGYVIFADYDGKSQTDSRAEVFSNITTYDNNVTDYNGKVIGTEGAKNNYPYVTSSPLLFIDSEHFLTGDGVDGSSYNKSVFKKIVGERASAKGAYKAYTELTEDEVKAISDAFSNSLLEFDEATGIDQEFPMLVISNTDYSVITPIINNYLHALTNTNYNFASETNADIYTTALNTCIYSDGKFTLQKSVDNNQANLYKDVAGKGDPCFRMDANRVDNGHEYAQFTLLDVQFKDPADSNKIAYHLYVPIFVKKILEYEFTASIETGTNYYPMSADTSVTRTLFENLGNAATIKFEYRYNRDAEAWRTAVNDGENMLGNLYKSLDVVYSNCQWPAGTRLVLVDANNHDRCYYLDTITNQETLDLSEFIDDERNAYAPAALNDLMSISISQSSNGTLVRNDIDGNNTSENATVRGDDGTYYRYATSEDTGERYTAVNVTNIQSERYYLSVFTPKSKTDTAIYHIEILSSGKFAEKEGQIGWRPNEVTGSNLPVHLITGQIYGTEYALTANSQTGSEQMSSTNYFLNVEMTASTYLTASAIAAGIPSNMTSAPNSTIYQTFLMTYDTKKSADASSIIGLSEQAYPYITVNSYNIYRGKTVDGDVYKNILSENKGYTPSISGTNYIELWNNANLISELPKAENNYSVTTRVNFNVAYDSNALGYQFPKKTNAQSEQDIGAKVIGYSNISSDKNTAAYSQTSWRQEGTSRYYTEDDKNAVLSYNVKTTPDSEANIAGPYSSLGINALELGNTTSHIDSTVVYDISELKATGSFVEFTIKLSSRADSYNDELTLADYFKNLSIEGANGQSLLTLKDGQLTLTDTEQIKVSKNEAGTEYRVRVHKSLLPTLGQDGIFTISVSYDVYTGDDKFNSNGYVYSNYMVTVSAALYDDMTGSSFITASNASDHIIYTNAKLQSKVFD